VTGPGRGRVLVIGIGNGWRGDDAAGLAVARRLRAAVPPGVEVLEHAGEPVSLIDAWPAADAVYLADAVSSGGEPGTVYRFDATGQPLGARFARRGTHAFGVADTVELARALRRLPRRIVVYGIEGASFAAGASLSPPVRRAVRTVSARLLAELPGPATRTVLGPPDSPGPATRTVLGLPDSPGPATPPPPCPPDSPGPAAPPSLAR